MKEDNKIDYGNWAARIFLVLFVIGIFWLYSIAEGGMTP